MLRWRRDSPGSTPTQPGQMQVTEVVVVGQEDAPIGRRVKQLVTIDGRGQSLAARGGDVVPSIVQICDERAPRIMVGVEAGQAPVYAAFSVILASMTSLCRS